MVGAGLLARNAVARGLRSRRRSRPRSRPGSKAVTGYLEAAGLMAPLEALGFALAGYGCTTCIGNSGPARRAVAPAIEANDLVVAAVLSGNRNFEGRIHPLARASYLASPPLVVAFALAGRVDIDLTTEPLGIGSDGRPGHARRHLAVARRDPRGHRSVDRPRAVPRDLRGRLRGRRALARPADPVGRSIRLGPGSTYIAKPPFFEGLSRRAAPIADIDGARVLAVLGDSVTTDHISPAGSIAAWSPAGQWLQEHGVGAARVQLLRRAPRPPRGDDARHVRQHPAAQPPGRGQGGPVHGPPAGRARRRSSTTPRCATAPRASPLLVIAGREYGSGSSRDWAAKGTALLGVRAVLAESYERIHRSNLVGMGVLPLQFEPGDSAVVARAHGSRDVRRSTAWRPVSRPSSR